MDKKRMLAIILKSEGNGLGPELVVDGDMELAGVANWIDYATPTTKEKSSAQAHGGSQSLRVAADANNEGARQNHAAVVAGRTYRVTGWVYAVSGTAAITSGIGAGVTVVGTSSAAAWVKLTKDIVADASQQEYVYCVPGSGGESYYDDISVREVL